MQSGVASLNNPLTLTNTNNVRWCWTSGIYLRLLPEGPLMTISSNGEGTDESRKTRKLRPPLCQTVSRLGSCSGPGYTATNTMGHPRNHPPLHGFLLSPADQAIILVTVLVLSGYFAILGSTDECGLNSFIRPSQAFIKALALRKTSLPELRLCSCNRLTSRLR